MRKILIVGLLIVFSMQNVFATTSLENAPSSWAKEEVESAISETLIPEYMQTGYKENISRGDLCSVIARTYCKIKNVKMESLIKEKSKFKDVDFSKEYGDYIKACETLGYIKGITATSFAPENELTREQMAVILYRFKNDVSKDKLPVGNKKYKDNNKISSWAKSAVKSVSALGIMKGNAGNLFGPKGKLTREQAYLTVNRTYNSSKGEEPEDKEVVDKKEENKEQEKDNEAVETSDDEKKTNESVEKNDNDKKADKSLEKNKTEKVDNKQVEEDNNTKKDNLDAKKEKVAPIEEKKETLDLEQMKKQVLNLVNKEREKAGVAPVKECAKYNDYADLRAKEIVEKFSHTRPDGSSCFSGMSNYKTVGENIAGGQSTPEIVMNDWMHSEGHKANILNGQYEELSVGIKYDDASEYKYYWVQLFYTPR